MEATLGFKILRGTATILVAFFALLPVASSIMRKQIRHNVDSNGALSIGLLLSTFTNFANWTVEMFFWNNKTAIMSSFGLLILSIIETHRVIGYSIEASRSSDHLNNLED